MTTDTTNDPAVRDLAHALFMLTSETQDETTRKAEWDAARRDHLALARKVLRRLEGQGYALSKAG